MFLWNGYDHRTYFSRSKYPFLNDAQPGSFQAWVNVGSSQVSFATHKKKSFIWFIRDPCNVYPLQAAINYWLQLIHRARNRAATGVLREIDVRAI